MPDDATHLDFEKSLRQVDGGNAAEFDDLRDSFAEIVMLFA